jgi:hypothetical protein
MGGCEHVRRKIVHNILKVGVILKKILSPFIDMTSRRALCVSKPLFKFMIEFIMNQSESQR